MSILRLLSLATLVSLCGFASASSAQAANYASFVVENPTGEVIHYQVKWGDGDWKSYCLDSGEKMYHAYPMNDDGTAPAPLVRFDWIAGDDEVTYRTYRVNFYSVNNPWKCLFSVDLPRKLKSATISLGKSSIRCRGSHGRAVVSGTPSRKSATA